MITSFFIGNLIDLQLLQSKVDVNLGYPLPGIHIGTGEFGPEFLQHYVDIIDVPEFNCKGVVIDDNVMNVYLQLVATDIKICEKLSKVNVDLIE